MVYDSRYISSTATIVLAFLIVVNPIFILLLLIFLIATILAHKNGPKKSINDEKEKEELSTDYSRLENNTTNTDQTFNSNLTNTKYIEELDKEFSICCYQSARLSDKYCSICGKVVNKKLINLINETN